MGLPMVQVFMIMVRQMSKPLAERIMRYGKTHPFFSEKILVPTGRKIILWSRKLQLKRLGLKQTEEIVPVSEKEALEQASEFIQQVVIFLYTVSVLSAYHFYISSKPSPKYVEEAKFEESTEKLRLENATLSKKIEILEKRLLFLGDNTRLNNKKMWDELCKDSIKDIKIVSSEGNKDSTV
ncbi:Optic atrophy 3-like family-containing protein [Strongyloides ratti]|uniref:Optic atrophy 3-like family-containing protein n=1 Tax=Strongyloides ratti TaxID=34506 RepID=A0A090L327_STRRB|nr:Optic atrophy 3-like family-containing protein [Strongyloides ratti]CEF61884.1 Optic atrophy 3-like family-containing protein [Strongyloides ratti]